VLLTADECREFLDGARTFQFDLYRIPFNDGNGGKPEPLAGASRNGMSNYFPRYSPDGKWIVFCKARSFMLLQPHSELYIIPAEGGEARRMRCNTSRMNSWHSWSPNGRWLVFSSKCNSPYTQLFLTHIDAEGRSSPAVLLDWFTAPDKAANIPEFVNAKPGMIRRIREQFVDDASLLYAGQVNARTGFHAAAVRDFQNALEINPGNIAARLSLGTSLAKLGKLEEAERQFARAVQIEPDNPLAHEGWGNVLAQQRRFRAAAAAFREALRLDPRLATAHFRLGVVLMDSGEPGEAQQHLAEAVRLDPFNAKASYSLGVSLVDQGKLKEAVPHFRRAVEVDPDFVPALVQLASILATSTDPAVRNASEAVRHAARACELTRYQAPAELAALSDAHAANGNFSEAAAVAERALQAARTAGHASLAGTIQRRVDLYRRGKCLPQPPSP
jgi:cytochrome c-type biogenesis protein CcmH/NrfG